MVKTLRILSLALASLVVASSLAVAQAVVTGVVKDASGAVLPGVTVEAASPALIEKVRTGVSDGSGQYRIVDLRPGSYTVTFSLAGFNTLKREGVGLSGTATVVINADLKVGTVEETVTVTGESPLIDVQSTVSERTVTRALLDSVPTGRTVFNVAALIPGMITVATNTIGQDVGGSSLGGVQSASIHGGATSDQRVLLEGLPINSVNGNGSGFISNFGSTQEFTIDTSGVSAEDSAGGVRMNIIPRAGGNDFHATVYGDGAGPALASVNFTPDLAARGMPAPNPAKSLKQTWTFNPAFGGPVVHDKLWYYFAGNKTNNQNYWSIYPNKNAGNPNAWTYVPDTSAEQSVYNLTLWTINGRLTWQMADKHKISFYFDQQSRCTCPQANATNSPEALTNEAFPAQHFASVTYSAPITSRLLLDAAVLNRLEGWGRTGLADPSMIRVSDSVTGISYRNFAGELRQDTNVNNNVRAAASFVTGAHSFKTGFMTQISSHKDVFTSSAQNVDYTFANGVPNQITLYADPRGSTSYSFDLGLFAQDRWTIKRLTLNGGIRYDRFTSHFPEVTIGPVPLAPNRNISFPARDGLNWNDITTRAGAAYDVFGNGKTSVKVSMNKYLVAQATSGGTTGANALNPANLLVTSTTRSWNDFTFPAGDPRRGNFVPDCVLTQTTANGECGALAASAFGQSAVATTFDPALLSGWGIRRYNWEFAASVQQQVLSRVSLDVGYFRRSFGNFMVTDNRSVASSDYTAFSYTAPTDARLLNGGGQSVSGLFNLNPNKVGQVDNFFTMASNYGTQIQRWQGLDANAVVRAQGGLTLQGGMSTGSTLNDICEVQAQLPEISPINPYCRTATLYLTQIKGLGSYLVPKVAVQLAVGIQSVPGPVIAANQVVTNAVIQPSLGRPLSGNAPNANINLVAPGQLYGERLNQVDLRLSKIFHFGKARLNANADLFNAFNSSAVLVQNDNYTATWQAPQAIVSGRLIKFSAQFDF